MQDSENARNVELSRAKRKQVFKKSRSKEIKAQIAELRLQSKKLKKKDIAQKEEKGKIAKQIKALKAMIRKSGENESSGSESE